MVSRLNRLPYDYYTLPFCAPSAAQQASAATSKDVRTLGLGQILQGERARLTPHTLHLLQHLPCAHVCTANFSVPNLNLLAARILKGYRVRLTLDDLPVVVRRPTGSYRLGYPLGDSAASTRHIEVTNHLAFSIMYHIPDEYEKLSLTSRYATPETVYRIVGFEVTPMSVADNTCPATGNLDVKGGPFVIPAEQRMRKPTEIPFTYTVQFVKSDVRWATRYDTLLKVSSGRQTMQMFAIVNSMMLALFLTASLAVVLFRTLRRDCARYGIAPGEIMDDFNDDFDNDVGWRMLRGDVFRAPAAVGMLSVLCGSGAQLVVVSIVTLAFALLGIVSPHRRGNLISGLLFFWVVSSGIGGYVAARLHKAMGGVRWKLVTFGVALVLPGVAFSTFFVVNLFVWMMGSIGAAPFLTMFLLLFLWLGVSVPLAFAGTYLGYRRKAYDFPVRTNQIPRPIPRQPKYLSSPWVHMISGILPFGVVCIELRVILNSIYLDEFYHFFGFLVAVFTILAITCAEVSVVVVFIKLSNCDYGWWWNSWFASASSGCYVLLYSIYYLLTSPGADAKNVVSNFLFLAYSTLGSICFGLLTGTIGFLSSLAFVRRIYSDSVDD
ncbi:unnamed protein product [Chondrus crispus]|uniref:Transmembrane 9 superfamily member n=1 Tax=Chondrus crispus TaxID=2769 RepID=R7QGJ3_CHOCR|nr:unnamed protein product [Chondrus crispus]CDF36576.1 unnamed protein product [Chondrus crispus]|eukprot:XP_005716395.1 unnamed protein product [Chondrus crispus]